MRCLQLSCPARPQGHFFYAFLFGSASACKTTHGDKPVDVNQWRVQTVVKRSCEWGSALEREITMLELNHDQELTLTKKCCYPM